MIETEIKTIVEFFESHPPQLSPKPTISAYSFKHKIEERIGYTRESSMLEACHRLEIPITDDGVLHLTRDYVETVSNVVYGEFTRRKKKEERDVAQIS